jgi:hypothetical protein
MNGNYGILGINIPSHFAQPMNTVASTGGINSLTAGQ